MPQVKLIVTNLLTSMTTELCGHVNIGRMTLTVNFDFNILRFNTHFNLYIHAVNRIVIWDKVERIIRWDNFPGHLGILRSWQQVRWKLHLAGLKRETING